MIKKYVMAFVFDKQYSRVLLTNIQWGSPTIKYNVNIWNGIGGPFQANSNRAVNLILNPLKLPIHDLQLFARIKASSYYLNCYQCVIKDPNYKFNDLDYNHKWFFINEVVKQSDLSELNLPLILLAKSGVKESFLNM